MKPSFAMALLLGSLNYSSAEGADFAQITKLQGEVFFEGKSVQQGQALAAPGVITSGVNSSAHVKILANGTEVRLTPGTRMKLDADSGELLQGSARWKVLSRKSLPAGKHRFIVRTGSAVMGVRGTDFMGVFNALLGESEIVVFEGEVAFESAKDSNDAKVVRKGQWGGIGGRFRQKIGDLIDLPPHVIEAFKVMTE